MDKDKNQEERDDLTAGKAHQPTVHQLCGRREWMTWISIVCAKFTARRSLRSVVSPMGAQPQQEPRPLVPLLLLHFAAAGVCFAFFSAVPIVGCLVLMAIGNDPGGPMFFPVYALGVLLFAVVTTGVLAGAAVLSDILRRHHPVPIWLPPIVVLLLASAITRCLFGSARPAVPLIAGAIAALAFIVHWAAVYTVWILSSLLFRLFRVQRMSNREDTNQAKTSA